MLALSADAGQTQVARFCTNRSVPGGCGNTLLTGQSPLLPSACLFVLQLKRF